MIARDAWMSQWDNPPSIFRGAPFWAWNGRLDPDRLCRAVESMHEAGMGGFFMHSRYGLKTPYLSEEWFRCVSACVQKARELNMKAYLYDEDRWPSGAAGGLVTRDNPDFGLHMLVARPAGLPESFRDAQPLASFAVKLAGDGRLLEYHPADEAPSDAGSVFVFAVAAMDPNGWHNNGAYLDTLNARAVDEFIHDTHQAYADRYGEDFGDLIPAIFTDEPNVFPFWFPPPGHEKGARLLPWTPDLPREFIRRRGYDLRDKLPELLWPGKRGEFSKVRHDYYRTIAEMFVENFTARIGGWCEKNGIALTGHMLMEEGLASQTSMAGAAMPHYEHMQWPGIDLLCDQTRELSTTKQCSSVADQLGRQRVLSELYGCTGWDWPLEGHKFIGDWQYACGVNFRCPHLTHYSLAGGGKRDYPASIFTHSPWWKYYHAVEDYFARLGLILTQGQAIRDVLVIHPVESAWGVLLPKGAQESGLLKELEDAFSRGIRILTGSHHDWDFGDESLLAKHAKCLKSGLKVGRMTYQLVVVLPSVTLRSTTVELLKRFLDGGGKVVFAGRTPTLVDAEPDDRPAQLAARAETVDSVERLPDALDRLLTRRVSITENGKEADFIWSMVRGVSGGRFVFLQSHDRKRPRHVRVRVAGKAPAVLWDLMTGTKTKLAAELSDGFVAFDLHLGPTGSALVSVGLPAKDAQTPRPERQVVETRSIEGPYPIELTEPNTLPLDYCRFRVGDAELSEPVPTLEADNRIREHFGLELRGADQCQPWYLYATGTADLAPRGRAELRWAFRVTDVPPRCRLAIENPGDYRISVNGQTVRQVDGWWVDEDIKTLDVSGCLRPGDNEVLLAFDFRPDMEIEDAYLVGDFGVAVRGGGKPEPGNLTLVSAPKDLRLGSWVGQGLDFYGAAVRYRLSVECPQGARACIRLPEVACTAAAVHVGERTFVLPWAPFEADITDALQPGTNLVTVEVIGGRKNILGPLHVPWLAWTGPTEFAPRGSRWLKPYQLVDHGLTACPILEIRR